MDIGFIHLTWPQPSNVSEPSAATQYIQGMDKIGHDITVYCLKSPDTDQNVSDEFSIEYLNIDRSFPKHSGESMNNKILERKDTLSDHDVLHSYSNRCGYAIGKIGENNDVSTILTLNAYKTICPKNDLLYLDHSPCRSRSILKCSICTGHSKLKQIFPTDGRLVWGMISSAHSQLNHLRDIRITEKTLTKIEYIDAFHVYANHSVDIFTQFGFPPNRFFVVPLPLDTSFLTDDNDRSNIDEDIFKLLYVGRLSYEKGVDRFPEIIYKINKIIDKEVGLTIVGSGYLDKNIKKEAKNLDVFDKIHMRGHVPNNELPSIYANHDLFVYPGRVDEAFGRVFLESMASQTPIVATDSGSAEEIINGGGLIANKSLEAIVEKIQQALDNQIIYNKLLKGARYRSLDFHEEKIIPQFESMYQEIV